MNRRYALAAVSACLLLGNTAIAAHAQQTWTTHDRTSAPMRSKSLAVTASYFDALNQPGKPNQRDLALNRLYAPNVTLTESLLTGQPQTHTGLRQVRAFDQRTHLSWFVYSSRQLSPTVVLSIEGVNEGPGHEGQNSGRWLTLTTVKNGKIITLVWMPC
jgi:hypothetical protein